MRTGLYQWLEVFDGDIKNISSLMKEDYEKYDVVHLNLSGGDYCQVQKIREMIKDSSTKFVVSNDYGAHEFQTVFPHPDILVREIAGCDAYFATEPYSQNFFEQLLGKEVHLIPHPANIEWLKKLKSPHERQKCIGIVYHYDGNQTFAPYIATKDIVAEKGYRTAMLGYQLKMDKQYAATRTLFHDVQKHSNFFDFCQMMLQCEVIYEPYCVPSYGRATVDSAALGVPTVGSYTVDSMRRCFPKTCNNPFNLKEINKTIRKLLDNNAFYYEVQDLAQKQSEHYNHKNSKERYMTMLEGIKK